MNKLSPALICTLLATLACETATATVVPTFDPNSIQTAIVGTAQAAQTQTRAASTDTPLPTNTQLPTDTPLPTNTPLPTETPLPLFTATALPQPITYEGRGEEWITLPPDALGVLDVVADQAVGLNGINENGITTVDELLIGSFGPYEGRVPLNLIKRTILRLHVITKGSWKIIYYPLGSAYDQTISDGGNLTMSGSGDDVWLSTLHIEPEKLLITWEPEKRKHLFVDVIGLKNHDSANLLRLYDRLTYWYPDDLGELFAVIVSAKNQRWEIKIYP